MNAKWKLPLEQHTIAVDFDGVLHAYDTPWTAHEVIPDGPVPGAMDWLRDMLTRFRVVVFSTRAGTLAGRKAIREWLIEHFDPALVWQLEITDHKPKALVYIDDRAWRFAGTFPTPQEIHDARPWNHHRRHPDQIIPNSGGSP